MPLREWISSLEVVAPTALECTYEWSSISSSEGLSKELIFIRSVGTSEAMRRGSWTTYLKVFFTLAKVAYTTFATLLPLSTRVGLEGGRGAVLPKTSFFVLSSSTTTSAKSTNISSFTTSLMVAKLYAKFKALNLYSSSSQETYIFSRHVLEFIYVFIRQRWGDLSWMTTKL